MSNQIRITMFPAKEGDCLLIAIGEEAERKFILIDAGRAWTYKNALKQYLHENEITNIELLVVTHVDRDHIDGMLQLIKDPDLNLKVNNVWFNTWDHLNNEKIKHPESDDELEVFGAKMGEELSSEIIARGWPWNSQFDGGAVEMDEDLSANVFQISGVTLTLLSPDREKLELLIPDWLKECRKAGITPGYTVEDYVVTDDNIEDFGAIDIDELADEEFKDDHSTANGSSIAFILEYNNCKYLLSGDAHPDLLVKSLKNLGTSEDNPIEIDVFKIPHHGSKYNISKELLNLMICKHYLVATNGNYFKHPDDIAMARLIKYGTKDATINFNYCTDYTKLWKNPNWQRRYHYQTNYPQEGDDGYLTLFFEN